MPKAKLTKKVEKELVWFTAKAAAETLHVSERTIWRRLANGTLRKRRKGPRGICGDDLMEQYVGGRCRVTLRESWDENLRLVMAEIERQAAERK